MAFLVLNIPIQIGIALNVLSAYANAGVFQLISNLGIII
jgi:hypothetical protein